MGKGGSSLDEMGWDFVGKDMGKSCDQARGGVKSCAGWDNGTWKGEGKGKGKGRWNPGIHSWKPSEEE